ncbi:MAG: hypothetical protein P4L85_08775 [Paludisphaera borealis]|uniref:hypothetical protein n=1 Tax=Paludisphaera borealis TaxID=1387353 RepID=UPI0028437266|nr:hypothetical protein [Paludisphaera borealis]MDR3619430.1 hypothetical protein [Paludisphaera borealis]
MTTRPRTSRKPNIHLESLESREAPAVGISGAWQAALAHSQSPEARAIHLQGEQQAIRIARHGTALQGHAAVSPGGASNVKVKAVDGLPTRQAALLAQAQARRAAQTHSSSGGAATPNRAWMTASPLRSPTRAPATPVATPTPPPAPTTPMSPPDQTNNAGPPAQNLPPNVSGVLNVIYQNFLTNSSQPIETGPGSIPIVGSNVGVNIHGNGQGDFSDFLSTLRNLGMEITTTSDVTWTVVGMLPISQLPTAAQTPQTLSITPQYSPKTN